MTNRPWHNLPINNIYSELETTEQGLLEAEAKARLKQWGRNELPKEEGHPAWLLFLTQFKSPLMYIMMLATAVSFYIGNNVEGVFIFCVMVSNALVGFYQEHKANKSLQALNSAVRKTTRVSRGGNEIQIDVAEIVPGDIVILRAGDSIPADGRVIEQLDLKVNEASLTGEAKLVAKQIEPVAEQTELGDRTNMLFLGTTVAEGTAKIVVVATGANTEYGDIISLLKDTPEEKTPLQKTVISLSKIIGIFITIVVGIIILEGIIAGHTFPVIFETALALFVSSIPEGLLPSITIILVLGMRRILRQRGLVRRLAATETLGGVTVICTDKTGTLTEGKMEVETLLTADGFMSIQPESNSWPSRTHQQLLEAGILATDAYVENPEAPASEAIIRGNSTEIAVTVAAMRSGIHPMQLKNASKVTDNILFSSHRKFSASLRTHQDGRTIVYLMGAPEQVATMVSHVDTNSGAKPLTDKSYANLLKEHETYISNGYRTVACAYKYVKPADAHKDLESLMTEMHFLGFITIADPIRADVPDAFQKTHQAGIRTVIVTGDHPLTALAVAQKIGFEIKPTEVLMGHEIEAMSDQDLSDKIKTTHLFARVSPRHKIRIVKAFQNQGEVVAMFGDGINDTPALKASDIGVAVNSQIDAAREAADITLLDGGFGVITAAIEQGRIIFNSIRRVFLYLIVQDFSQFFLFIVSIIAGLPLPLLAAQLLLVNLVESGLPDLALTTEQEKDGLMSEPPRDPKESILNPTSRKWMFIVFAISGCLAMLLFVFLFGQGIEIEKVRTMMMAFLCMESLLLVFTMRSFSKSIFRKDIFSNKILTGAVIISLGMLLLAVYTPFLQSTLSTVSLSAKDWAIILSVNIIEIIIINKAKLDLFSKRIA